ncbi:LOW QUALITY PROTEIN: mitochondrial 2-oxodicarboxylate carrier [Sarcophilus harrisii]
MEVGSSRPPSSSSSAKVTLASLTGPSSSSLQCSVYTNHRASTGWLFGFYKGILPSILVETPKRAVKQPSTLTYEDIIKMKGMGLQRLTETLRHGIFNMIYFGFYFSVNAIPVCEDPNLEFWRNFGIGLLSGIIASIINIPFDVAKSKIQRPQVLGKIKHITCFKTMATIYQEKSFFALYENLLPKIMRLGPGGAVMLLAYEYIYSWVQENL